MSTHSNDPDPSANAEELFFAYLIQREEPEAEDFESLCARHPEHAAALRVLHADLERVGGLISKSNKHESMQATLASMHGKSLDPGISLEPARGASDSITERLEEHAPGASRYEIKGEVARGGMGVILKAWDRDLRRSMAMKALLAERAPEEDGPRPKVNELHLRRFLEEAQITGQLEHPGIVPVHELGIDSEGRVYFTMPLVRGREFKRIISLVRDGEEGWTLNKALRVLQKVCEAVAYAHAKGVIHRDLKPANIMVGSFGETYVMDWGLARVLDRKDTRDIRVRKSDESSIQTERMTSDATPLVTMDGAVIGTPAYMSPEQAAGRIEQLDERTDVYALGAMLYHLLTFQMPYVARGQFLSPQSVLRARLNGPPLGASKINPEAPTEVVEICEKAMADAPDARYRTALELSADLEAYLGGRAVSAHETSLGYQLGLAYKRHRPVFVTAIAAVVLLLVGAGMYVRQQQQALRNEQDARRQEQRALLDRTRELDLGAVRLLPPQVDRLFPLLPDTIPSMQAWIERTEGALGREEVWQAELEQAGEQQRAELSGLLEGIGELRELRRAVEGRVETARATEDPAYLKREASWARAIEEIKNSPTYEGLVMKEIPGLLPLGEDLSTGMFEFWNHLSGAKPRRDSVTGRLDPHPDDGIVLVLLPGGTYTMGPLDLPDSDWLHEVTLEPFLLGKYEVTQAQWLRVMGYNPSLYSPGHEVATGQGGGSTYQISLLHPVTNLTWFESAEFCARASLALPLEAQWEYAAKAGTTTVHYWGNYAIDVMGKENFYNRVCEAEGFPGFGGEASWVDGYCGSAPIGAFEPNGFGLYDTLANVTEWCEEWAGDEDLVGPGKRKHKRGSSYLVGPGQTAFSDWRQWWPPSQTNEALGMRAARALE